jgi:glutathione S-transferase
MAQPYSHNITVRSWTTNVKIESRAIVRYITAKFGDGTLIPSATDFQAIGLFEQAASIEYGQFDNEASKVVFWSYIAP